jgi:ribosome modulation factor
MSTGRNPTEIAERKGREAGLAGLGADACPYQDKRQNSGRLTFSRAWRNSWLAGWKAGREEMLRLTNHF